MACHRRSARMFRCWICRARRDGISSSFEMLACTERNAVTLRLGSTTYEDGVHQEVKQELCNEFSSEETSPSK